MTLKLGRPPFGDGLPADLDRFEARSPVIAEYTTQNAEYSMTKAAVVDALSTVFTYAPMKARILGAHGLVVLAWLQGGVMRTEISPEHQERIDAGATCHKAAIEYRTLGLSPLILCDPEHISVAHINSTHAKRCDSPGKAPVIAWKIFQDPPTYGSRNQSMVEAVRHWQCGNRMRAVLWCHPY